MKNIRKRSNCYAVFFRIGIFLTAWFAAKLMTETAFVFGAASIALLMLLIKQSRLLCNASLLWNNRILAVPSAVISIPDSKEKRDAGVTIVSTFGILRKRP